jgi:2-polyprenyl-3-methyl-5-hydroxy-6-metoxy-1,4-benzoquinol methylase
MAAAKREVQEISAILFRPEEMSLSEPNPAFIFEMMTAHQRSAAMKAGIELGVFDALGAGPATAAELAKRAQVAERGMRILCDCLTIYGVIAREEGRYQHTPTSAVFLDAKSPASMASMWPFLMNDKILLASRLLTDTIRLGRTALPETLAGDEVKEWVTFAQTMQPMMAGAAEYIADVVLREGAPAKVLDVAASHGLFGFAIGRRVPACEIVALDFPSVLEVTKEHARAAGVTITPLPGSAFTAELGTGYDAVLVTNLFHHFSPDDCIALMRRFHAALRPGGRMVVLEFVPNEDRLTPPVVAAFAMMMLVNTPAGDSHPMSEYDRMLDAAGFGARELTDVPQSAHRLIVARR